MDIKDGATNAFAIKSVMIAILASSEIQELRLDKNIVWFRFLDIKT
jgi:hypothetical protein